MQSVDRLVLRGAAIPTLIVGVAASLLAALLVGSKGLIGGLLGTVIVLVFFTVGQLVLGRVLRDNPTMAMTVAMTLYLVKVGILFGFILLFAGTTAFDTKAFGLTIVACTLTWTGAEVWVFARTKVLVIEPGSGPGKPAPGPASQAAPNAAPDAAPKAVERASEQPSGDPDPAPRQGDRP